MQRSMLFSCLLSMGFYLGASEYELKTALLHQEVVTHKNPNITQETHPTLYNLVRELALKADIDIPRYITLYAAEYTFIDQNGYQHEAVRDMTAYVDIVGDMHICRELIIALPYEDIQGVVAIAIAAKARNVPLKKLGAFSFTFVGGLAALCHQLAKQSFSIDEKDIERNKVIGTAGIASTTLSSLLIATLYANNAQKTIDIDAMRLTEPRNVINAIRALSKVTDTYVKEGFLSRITPAILKKLCRMMFYPLRAYTPEERVAYLHRACESRIKNVP